MKSNVVDLRPPAASAAVEQAEPIEAAVREVGARLAENKAERLGLRSRLDELESLTPSLRRRRPRGGPVEPSRPVTFYSIEEAPASESSPLQVA